MSVYNLIPVDMLTQLQTDVGVLLSEFDITNIGQINDEDVICATTGGISISCVPEYVDLGEEYEDCPKNTEELKQLVGWTCTFSFTSLGTNENNIRLALGAADMDDVTGAITPRLRIDKSDYKDIWWVGGRANGGIVAAQLMNALSTSGFNLKTSKSSVGQVDIELTGHIKAEEQETIPITIYSINSGVSTGFAVVAPEAFVLSALVAAGMGNIYYFQNLDSIKFLNICGTFKAKIKSADATMTKDGYYYTAPNDETSNNDGWLIMPMYETSAAGLNLYGSEKLLNMVYESAFELNYLGGWVGKKVVEGTTINSLAEFKDMIPPIKDQLLMLKEMFNSLPMVTCPVKGEDITGTLDWGQLYGPVYTHIMGQYDVGTIDDEDVIMAVAAPVGNIYTTKVSQWRCGICEKITADSGVVGAVGIEVLTSIEDIKYPVTVGKMIKDHPVYDMGYMWINGEVKDNLNCKLRTENTYNQHCEIAPYVAEYISTTYNDADTGRGDVDYQDRYHLCGSMIGTANFNLYTLSGGNIITEERRVTIDDSGVVYPDTSNWETYTRKGVTYRPLTIPEKYIVGYYRSFDKAAEYVSNDDNGLVIESIVDDYGEDYKWDKARQGTIPDNATYS